MTPVVKGLQHAESDVDLTVGPPDLPGIFRTLDVGGTVSIELRNGLVTSSKEITKNGDKYTVFHLVDGTETAFSRKGIREVLLGLRSPWYSDL